MALLDLAKAGGRFGRTDLPSAWGGASALSGRAQGRIYQVVVGTLIVLCAFGSGSVSAAIAYAQTCQFELGFATLHDLIPDIVGDCVDNEHHDAVSGDALQDTTHGLLVWRKTDDWTAFSNGYHTWLNGPLSLQDRSNDQRFWWETNPDHLPITPPPLANDRCHTAGLDLFLAGGEVGLGHAGVEGQFTNTLSVACTFQGYVGAQLIDVDSNPLPTQVIRGGGYLFPDPGPSMLTVPPGGSARFGLEWVQVPTAAETECRTAAFLAVSPPDEYVPLRVAAPIMACEGGRLTVTAILLGPDCRPTPAARSDSDLHQAAQRTPVPRTTCPGPTAR